MQQGAEKQEGDRLVRGRQVLQQRLRWRHRLLRRWPRAGDHAAAAAIAASHLGIHPAMSTLGGGLSVLGPYLHGAARSVRAAAAAPAPADDAAVPRAMEHVWGMLSGQCERALSRFRQDAPEG